MYCTLLRLRLAGQLNIHGSQHRFVLAGRSVSVVAPDLAADYPDAYWISMRACGFETEEEALAFGTLLSESCQVSSVLHRLGLDPGVETPSTPGFFERGAKQARVGARSLRGIYHGLDVYAEDPGMEFVRNISNALYIPFPTQDFIAGIKRHFESNHAPVLLGAANENVLRLFNEALLQREPTSRTVLLISTVEMLSQDQEWTDAQRGMLKETADHVRSRQTGSSAEREEVASAIEKLYRLSLRQGVFRLLQKIGLSHLRKTWDDLYDERCRLVHANEPNQQARHAALADRATAVCGRILIAALRDVLNPLPEDLETWYSLAGPNEMP